MSSFPYDPMAPDDLDWSEAALDALSDQRAGRHYPEDKAGDEHLYTPGTPKRHPVKWDGDES